MPWRKLVIVGVLAAGLGGCGGSGPVVPVQPVLTSIVISPSSASLQLPATQQFKATGEYSDGSSQDVTQTVNWTSSDGSVATISNASGTNGLATMVGSGTAQIGAGMEGMTASVKVTVSSTVGISIAPTFASVTVTHQTASFSATVQGTTNTAVAWSVDGVAGGDATLGTISASGVYTPPSSGGFHTITATSQADLGKSASAQLAVTDVPGVYTRQYDNARTGLNPDEIVLTLQSVNAQQLGEIASYTVDGNVFAQPLYVANVDVPGVGYRNLVYVATINDEVYAFDADGKGSGPVWEKTLLDTSAGETPVPCSGLPSAMCEEFPTIGIVGTPVIDPATGTLYVDTLSEINGTPYHKLHALDIATGAEKFGGPVTIAGSVPGTGPGSDGTTVTFDAYYQLQRAGLLLANGNVYVAYASYGDTGPYHGWVFAYNASTLNQVAVFNDTPDGCCGGIWQGAGGLAADANGNIFLTTGNGDFNANTGGRDYGDSVIKLSPSLSVEDYFTPYNQAYLYANDLDLGSSSPLLLPDQSGPYPHLLVVDGKNGEIDVVNRDNMGHFNATDNSQIVQSIPGITGMVMVPSIYWNGHVYFPGQNGLCMFGIENGLLTTTPQLQASLMSVAGITISANGPQAGILWTIGIGSYEGGLTRDLLVAYDASNANLLYSSNQAGTRDIAPGPVPFQTALVVNGKVYVAGQSQITIYGLLPQ